MTAPSSTARERVLTAPLAVALAMLGVAACVAGPFGGWLKLNPRKQAIPLRAPLAALDESVLTPYAVAERQVLDSATLAALGTDQYLSWLLENETLPRDHPLRTAHLLVTYDTGGNTLVPHTPDVCWVGGGYEKAQPHEDAMIEVRTLPDGARSVPIRICTFMKTALRNRSKQTVVYTFHCNGRFVASRSGVRLLVNAPTNRYGYFSKVEVTFPEATRAEGFEGAGHLFERLLPALVAGHWPDFHTAEEAAAD